MATLFTTCTSTTTDDVDWYGWNDTWTTNCTASTWIGWNDTSNFVAWTPYEQTEEQKAAAKKAKDERAAAKERAERLLEENLSESQREELATQRYFTVEGGGSKRTYRVKAGLGVHGNVVEVDEQGREVANLCAAPRGDLPEADALIAQKLWLEHREEEFRQVANITQRRRVA